MMDQRSVELDRLAPAVVTMLRVNLGLGPGESVLVLTDVPSAAELARLDPAATEDFLGRIVLARAVAAIAAREFGADRVEYHPYPSVGQHGTEVPPEVARRMAATAVTVALTTYSLTHTEATAAAAAAGRRIASMPGITAAMFASDGPMAVDYEAVRRDTRRFADLLTEASEVRVVCPAGTDLTFSLAGRQGGADDGFLASPGSWGNLPAGEAFAAPVEGTARGRLVVRRGWYPGLDEDMTLVFEGGEVREIKGGGAVGRSFAERLRLDAPEAAERHRRNCAEIGIGTNPNARVPDNVLEAEKIKGTVHIAIGDSSHMGGRTVSDLHEDFVVPEPDVFFDGRPVIRRGRW